MSFLKFPSLLSYASWMMISSTLNLCSLVGSLSFRAFFPRMTEKRWVLAWELKHKRSNQRSVSTCCVHSDLTSYPSGKQWAAVRTQQAEIRLPPQRKTFSLVLLRQNMAATQGWNSTVATVPPTIFICLRLLRFPHVGSAPGGAKNKFSSAEGRKRSVRMMESVRWWGYLAPDQRVQAKVGLERQDERVNAGGNRRRGFNPRQ